MTTEEIQTIGTSYGTFIAVAALVLILLVVVVLPTLLVILATRD